MNSGKSEIKPGIPEWVRQSGDYQYENNPDGSPKMIDDPTSPWHGMPQPAKDAFKHVPGYNPNWTWNADNKTVPDGFDIEFKYTIPWGQLPPELRSRLSGKQTTKSTTSKGRLDAYGGVDKIYDKKKTNK